MSPSFSEFRDRPEHTREGRWKHSTFRAADLFRISKFGFRICSVVLLWLLSFVLTGCPGARDDLSDAEYHGEQSLSGSQEHLSRAVRMIEYSEDFNEKMAIAQVMTQLGQWIQDQPPVDEWTADPMTSTLPERYSRYVSLGNLSRMSFDPHDFFVLREAIWMRNISDWQVARKMDRRRRIQDEINALEDEIRRQEGQSDSNENQFDADAATHRLEQLRGELHPPWLNELRSAAGQQARSADEDLTTAMELFDWTVRNVQPLPTHWNAKMPAADAEQASTADAEKSSDAKKTDEENTLPPPGASMPVWRAVLTGHSDVATRARVFVLLARQQKIDVVILGLQDSQDKQPRTWAAAVVIGDELYLFEPELGLPFAGPNGEGVCTLSQLREDPSLLRQFDAGEDAPYHVQADDLTNIVAMIDATPAYLSQRMMLLERNLTGDQKLVLTTAPSGLARKLRKMSLPEAVLWTVPYREFEYYRFRLKHPKLFAEYEQETSVYYSLFPLLKARAMHFRGDLDKEDVNVYGAKHFYMRCRPSEREIQGQAEQLRRMLKAVKDVPENKRAAFIQSQSQETRAAVSAAMNLSQQSPEQQEKYIDQLQEVAHTAKGEATYWLGVAAMEQDQGGVAENYFSQRVLEPNPDGPFSDGARYNLARIYEASGRTEEAIALYEADHSPSRHGSLLRAKRLREQD